MAPEVAAGLPPTKDSKTIWDNIREIYIKLDRAKIFSLTQAMYFKSQTLAMEPPPPLERIYQLAVQEENQRMAVVGHA